jgi:hypothetical protein
MLTDMTDRNCHSRFGFVCAPPSDAVPGREPAVSVSSGSASPSRAVSERWRGSVAGTAIAAAFTPVPGTEQQGPVSAEAGDGVYDAAVGDAAVATATGRSDADVGAEELPRHGLDAFPAVYCCPREPTDVWVTLVLLAKELKRELAPWLSPSTATAQSHTV